MRSVGDGGTVEPAVDRPDGATETPTESSALTSTTLSMKRWVLSKKKTPGTEGSQKSRARYSTTNRTPHRERFMPRSYRMRPRCPKRRAAAGIHLIDVSGARKGVGGQSPPEQDGQALSDGRDTDARARRRR